MPEPDPVDVLVAQWSALRPDLDFAAMGLYSRLNRFALTSGREIEREMQRHGLSTGEFDVLSALRRAGPPHALKPSVLARHTMLTAAGMTSRLDNLEVAGLVQRLANPEDRRSAPVSLTTSGVRLVDKVVVAHLQNEQRLFTNLGPTQRKQLDAVLRALLPEHES